MAAALLVAAGVLSSGAQAGGARQGGSGRALVAEAARPRLKGVGARVAVQPFEGSRAEPLRDLVVRIVRGRGFRPMTSLPRYEGTGQYPSLARDHTVAAFVTADMQDVGRRQSITFLVWNGKTGSILGRWTAAAPAPVLARTVGKGFWQHLGPALHRAKAPAPDGGLTPARTMRIDASD